MPISRNKSGAARFSPRDELYYADRPEDFLGEGSEEYDRRVKEARFRVLEAFRFASVPLRGRGMCHEICDIGMTLDDLVNFIDAYDSKRIDEVRKQRARDKEITPGLMLPGQRRKSPQKINRRRAGLFSGSDIPTGFFYDRGIHFESRAEARRERAGFVDLMRWFVIEHTVFLMIENHEISLINDAWYVSVSVMDTHLPAHKQRQRKSAKSSKQVKTDDRSFHGRPNRDRDRVQKAA
jgi:hypothetical protein